MNPAVKRLTCHRFLYAMLYTQVFMLFLVRILRILLATKTFFLLLIVLYIISFDVLIKIVSELAFVSMS